MPLTRSELIKRIAIANGLADSDAAVALSAVTEAIAKGLEGPGRVEIRGFGAFQSRERAPRMARNPATGNAVHVGHKKIVHFKAGKMLADLLNADPAALEQHREKREQQCCFRDERSGQLRLF